MVFKYKLEYTIEIDERNIKNKYPNYQYNFNSPEELADSLTPTKIYMNDADMSKDGLELFGYSINVKRTKIK